MLRWMMGNTLRDRTRNECFCKKKLKFGKQKSREYRVVRLESKR